MMKKLTALLLAILLMSGLTLSVSADSGRYVVDDAGLLSSEEAASLEDAAAALSASYGIDVVILTVDSLGSSGAQDYADNYYDNNGYGEDGILFLLAMEEREWYISTCGSMIYALTDYGIQQVGEQVLPYLSYSYWYEGFCCYLESLPYYLDAYADGKPVDGYADYSGDYYHGEQEEVIYYPEEEESNLPMALLIGLATGGVSLGIMRSSMNTKRPQRSASVYLKDGSWRLSVDRDIFLYSQVSKTRRQNNSSGGGRPGGGSSVHRSSGGRSHGGGGGRF